MSQLIAIYSCHFCHFSGVCERKSQLLFRAFPHYAFVFVDPVMRFMVVTRVLSCHLQAKLTVSYTRVSTALG